MALVQLAILINADVLTGGTNLPHCQENVVVKKVTCKHLRDGRKEREEGEEGGDGRREGERDREIQNHVYKQSCSMLLNQCGGHRRSTHLDLLGECGREHHGLTLTHRRHPILLYNAADLRFKPHVQHTVSLVQHQIPCEGGREEREGKGRERGRGRWRWGRKGRE